MEDGGGGGGGGWGGGGVGYETKSWTETHENEGAHHAMLIGRG